MKKEGEYVCACVCYLQESELIGSVFMKFRGKKKSPSAIKPQNISDSVNFTRQSIFQVYTNILDTSQKCLTKIHMRFTLLVLNKYTVPHNY